MSQFVAEVKEWNIIFSAKQLSYKIAGQNKFKVYIDTDLTKKAFLISAKKTGFDQTKGGSAGISFQ